MNTGERRFGNPRTDVERAARHQGLYGTADLPSRGTGLRVAGTGSSMAVLAVVGIFGIGLAYLILRK